MLKSVIHNAYDGLVMINEAEEITFISPSLTELFELEQGLKEKTKIDKVLPHLDAFTSDEYRGC